jgi:hypothetical protein
MVMDKRQRIWMGIAVAVSFLVGLLLVWNDSAPGWFLLLMGAVYLGMLTRPGQGWAASRPALVKWGFIGTVLLVLLAAALVVITLTK